MLNTPWDCSDFEQFNSGGPTGARVFHKTEVPDWHPFLSTFWNGTCDEGQLTREGLDDAVQHGQVGIPPAVRTVPKHANHLRQDYWEIYSKKLGLLKSVNEQDIFVRTSVETRTMQVASGLLTGFDKSFATKVFPVTTQPSPVSTQTAPQTLLFSQ